MRICIIGKFPPIQGGVSARTYWTAHALAMRGHDVQVVTNAKEVSPPFRMHMRPEDWARCSASYGAGSVTVHWTEPVDRSQAYIPMASPFVSKLAAVAARAHTERPFDVILSHYLEPYGVAGCLAAAMTGVPHVARMAGSDAGRLWHHPQLELLYDHVLRSAEAVIAIGAVAERATERGVDAGRIVPGGAFPVSENLFTPEGPKLDIAGLRAQVEGDPQASRLLWGDFAGEGLHFGVYGKLGERKGTFALLSAMSRLKSAGIDLGLVALAHGTPTVEKAFRERAIELGLADRILQIPFLPHWRVPEFLRGCVAVWFRLQSERWAMNESEVAGLVAVRAPGPRLIEFDCDISRFMGAQTIAEFPEEVPPSRSYILAFQRAENGRRDPLLIDDLTARILQLSDGTLTVSEIVGKLRQDEASTPDDNIRWIEGLFLLGLISLRDTRVEHFDEAVERESGWTASVKC